MSETHKSASDEQNELRLKALRDRIAHRGSPRPRRDRPETPLESVNRLMREEAAHRDETRKDR